MTLSRFYLRTGISVLDLEIQHAFILLRKELFCSSSLNINTGLSLLTRERNAWRGSIRVECHVWNPTTSWKRLKNKRFLCAYAVYSSIHNNAQKFYPLMSQLLIATALMQKTTVLFCSILSSNQSSSFESVKPSNFSNYTLIRH